MNEIRRFNFEGHEIALHGGGGEWWATAEEAAEPLGYQHARSVTRLYRKHEHLFKPGEATRTNLCALDGKTRLQLMFSPRGLMRLCLLGNAKKNEITARFHDWLLDLADKLRGGARLVTEDQVLALRDQMRAMAEQNQRLFDLAMGLQNQNKALAGAVEVQASNAGRMLSYFSHSPEARRAIEEARDLRTGQKRFPFGGGPQIDGNTLYGGVNGIDISGQ